MPATMLNSVLGRHRPLQYNSYSILLTNQTIWRYVIHVTLILPIEEESTQTKPEPTMRKNLRTSGPVHL
jgi:hypothetical protein